MLKLEAGPSLVQLLGSLVQGNSLSTSVHQHESGDAKFLTSLSDSSHPSAFALQRLSLRELLLRHDLTPLVLHQLSFRKAALRVGGGSIPYLELRSGHRLL